MIRIEIPREHILAQVGSLSVRYDWCVKNFGITEPGYTWEYCGDCVFGFVNPEDATLFALRWL